MPQTATPQSVSKQAQNESIEQFGPYEILNALKRRFHWILICTAVCMGITTVTVWKWPDEYKSDTLILVDPQKVPERYVSATVSMDVGGRLSTINQQLMSSTRLQRVIETYDLYKPLKGRKTQEEIIEQMRKDIKVEIVKSFEQGGRNLGAFRISYQGRNPGVVAQVCNQLASQFIEENLRVREAQAEGTSEFIDTQLELAKKQLDDQEGRLRDQKMKFMGQLPEQQQSNLAALNQLQLQLQAEIEAMGRARQSEMMLNSQINQAVQARAQTRDLTGGDGGQVAVAAVPTSETLKGLKQQRGQAESNVQQLQLRYSETYPEVKRAKAILASIAAQIEEEERRLAAAPPPAALPPPIPDKKGEVDPRDPMAMQKNQLQVLRMELENRQRRSDNLSAQIRNMQGRLDNTPVREQEMSQIVRDVGLLRANYQSLLEKKQSADMAADMERRQKSERFSVLDTARVPEKPFRPNRPAMFGLGLALGLGMGLGMVFVREFQDNSIKKEDELARFGLRVLGRIPLVVTAEEVILQRRKKIRNWALGSVATMTVTGVGSGVAYLILRFAFVF